MEAMTGIVREGPQGLYVEADGRRYESPDLDAPEGTEVNVDPYTGIDDNPRATITWKVLDSTYSIEAREAF